MVKYFFLRDEKRFPIACVASDVVGLLKKKVAFAYSIYNPKDTFDKGLAKEVALGRLEKKGKTYGKVPFIKGEVKRRIAKAIATDDGIPSRVRAAANNFLKAYDTSN